MDTGIVMADQIFSPRARVLQKRLCSLGREWTRSLIAFNRGVKTEAELDDDTLIYDRRRIDAERELMSIYQACELAQNKAGA